MNKKICMFFCILFVFSWFFLIVITKKGENIYNNHKKERLLVGGDIKTGKQSQHSTSTY